MSSTKFSAATAALSPLRRGVRFLSALLARSSGHIRVAWLWVSVPGLMLDDWSRLAVGRGALLRTPNGGRVFLGRSASIGAGAELTASGGVIEVGDCTFIGSWTTVVARTAVRIGSHCLVAERVTIRDQDHDVRGPIGAHIAEAGFQVSEVEIGDDVWIGAGAVILRGVRIGRGAVVGANSVVNRDVASGDIVAGVPARVIGVRGG